MSGFIGHLLKNPIIEAALVLVIGWLLLDIREVIVAVFVSYIIMAALSPAVVFLRNKRVPKVVAVILAYFTTLLISLLLIVPLVPFFAEQIQSLINGFPTYLDKAIRLLGLPVDVNEINSLATRELDSIGRNAFTITSRALAGIFSLLTILVVGFYLLMESDTLKEKIAAFFPKNSQKSIIFTLSQIEEKLGAWLRGQIILSVSIGTMTWFALTWVGLSNALPLALLAGILEIIPTIGPILSAIPAVIIALTISPATAVSVIGVYIVIQLLENNVLVPKIMEKAVGLNPIVIIVLVTAGATLMGVIGALLAIPFASMLLIIYKSYKKPSI